MRHWEAAVELIRPQGGIVSVDDIELPMPVGAMKMMAASLLGERMFARAMYQTPDMIEQHRLLSHVAGEIARPTGAGRPLPGSNCRDRQSRSCRRRVQQ